MRLAEYVEKNNLTVVAHLLTHAHVDHLYGARFVYDKYALLPILSEADDWLFNHVNYQAAAFGTPLEDQPLDEYIPLESISTPIAGSRFSQLSIKNFSFQIIPTPGHSAGSVCFYFPDEHILFSGDTLFQGGVGRTDLLGGDYSSMMNSLYRLMELPNETMVYPGHGYTTSIALEKEQNPYL